MTNRQHIMVDIETLGTSVECVVMSIGLVRFTATEITDKFHVGIDPVDSERYGRKIDASTAWDYWANPKRAEARDRLFALPKVSLDAALTGVAMWVAETLPEDRGYLWGNGATFDNVRISSLFASAGIQTPFHYRQDVCYRTLKNLAPMVAYEQLGTAHDALDDALSQAVHLQRICAHYGIAL